MIWRTLGNCRLTWGISSKNRVGYRPLRKGLANWLRSVVIVRHIRGDGSSGGARCLQKTHFDRSVAGSGNLSGLPTSDLRAQPMWTIQQVSVPPVMKKGVALWWIAFSRNDFLFHEHD